MLDEIYSFQVSFWLGYFKSMFKTCKYVTSCTANRQFSQLSESVSFMRPKGFVDCELWLFSLTLGHWLKLSQQKAIHVDVTYGSKHWFLHELVTYALCDPRSHKRHNHVLRTVILATCSNQYRQQQQIPSTVSCSDEKWHSRRVPLSLVRVGNLRASLDYRNNVPLLILIVKLMWFSKPRGEVIAHFFGKELSCIIAAKTRMSSIRAKGSAW